VDHIAFGWRYDDVLFLYENGQPISSKVQQLMSEDWKCIIQQLVASGETLAVSAAPGSAKTTALREWCRGQPDQKILFLAFSKYVQIAQVAF
jgi:hypothetical protein